MAQCTFKLLIPIDTMAQATSGTDPEDESDISEIQTEKKQEKWFGLVQIVNYNEWMKRLYTDFYFRFITARLIHLYGYHWRHTRAGKNVSVYAGLYWLPLNQYRSAVERTKQMLDEWEQRDENMKHLSLYDNWKKCGYIRITEKKLYLDIIYKNKWFTNCNLRLSQNKIYFYRAQFNNDENGKKTLEKTRKIMTQRINLVYLAWRKFKMQMENFVPANHVPIISWKANKPQWIFIPTLVVNNISNDTNINTNKDMQPIASNNGESTGPRRSARLAAKQQQHQKNQKDSKTKANLNKYGPAVQKWINRGR